MKPFEIKDRKRLAEEVAKFCIQIMEDEEIASDPYTMGFMQGMLAAYGLLWSEVCRNCPGCKTPICPTKEMLRRMKHGQGRG